MSKNLIIILYFALAAIMAIGLIVVTIVAPAQLDSTVGWVVQMLGLASTAAVTIYLLGSQQKTLEEVKTNTNGNLTAMREQLAAKDATIADQQRQLLQVVGASPPADT